jgi:hypothetical protein
LRQQLCLCHRFLAIIITNLLLHPLLFFQIQDLLESSRRRRVSFIGLS